MKIEIDGRYKTDSNDVFGAIRLYPENNKEISDLEWLFSVFKQKEKNDIQEEYVKAEIIKANGGSYHHAIIYKN